MLIPDAAIWIALSKELSLQAKAWHLLSSFARDSEAWATGASSVFGLVESEAFPTRTFTSISLSEICLTSCSTGSTSYSCVLFLFSCLIYVKVCRVFVPSKVLKCQCSQAFARLRPPGTQVLLHTDTASQPFYPAVCTRVEQTLNFSVVQLLTECSDLLQMRKGPQVSVCQSKVVCWIRLPSASHSL